MMQMEKIILSKEIQWHVLFLLSRNILTWIIFSNKDILWHLFILLSRLDGEVDEKLMKKLTWRHLQRSWMNFGDQIIVNLLQNRLWFCTMIDLITWCLLRQSKSSSRTACSRSTPTSSCPADWSNDVVKYYLIQLPSPRKQPQAIAIFCGKETISNCS